MMNYSDIDHTEFKIERTDQGDEMVVTMYFYSGQTIVYKEAYPAHDPGIEFSSDQPNALELRALEYAKGIDNG